MPKQDAGLWAQLSALDAFPKVNEDFFKKTMSGGKSGWYEQCLTRQSSQGNQPAVGLFAGVITIVASVLMALLFFSELSKIGSCTCTQAALQGAKLTLLLAYCRAVLDNPDHPRADCRYVTRSAYRYQRKIESLFCGQQFHSPWLRTRGNSLSKQCRLQSASPSLPAARQLQTESESPYTLGMS